jgi:Ethanolamine utilization protein EutJ (predicted chaperonin)
LRWWRVFNRGRQSADTGEAAVVGPRRRSAIRYGYEAPLRAKCSSWPKFVELFTGDVSDGGLYIPTERDAQVGESVEVELSLPDGRALSFTGTVVNVIDTARAARFGKRAGLGVRLNPLSEEDRGRFAELVRAAQSQVPHPDESVTAPLPEPPVLSLPKPRAQLLFAPSAAPAAAPEPAAPGTAVRAPGARTAAPASNPPAIPRNPAPNSNPPTGARAATQVATPPPPRPATGRASTARPTAAPPPVPNRPTPPPRPSRPRATTIIGIDMGVTATRVAAIRDQQVRVLRRPDGQRTAPALLAFPTPGQILVGTAARERQIVDPGHTVAGPKRVLGLPHDDPEARTFAARAPYPTRPGTDGGLAVDMWGHLYTVPQLCSHLLREARELAESQLGQAVTQAVLTAPIRFDDRRLAALRQAARTAQIDVVSILDEPSAAALAHRLHPEFTGIIGLYDFGGGTFDFSILDVAQGDFRVLSTAGDTWLGGSDLDLAVAQEVASELLRGQRVDVRQQPASWQRLLHAVEEARCSLSKHDSTMFSLAAVLGVAEDMGDIEIDLDRPQLDRICAPLVQRSLAACQKALALIDMPSSRLHAIFLSGGVAAAPGIQQTLSNYFRIPVISAVPPRYAVCLGAAIHAAQLQFQRPTTLPSRA